MKSRSIPTLPAKDFVFPVLRPLMTIIKCLKQMPACSSPDYASDSASPPVVLRRECLSNVAFLAEALRELCRRGGIDQSECESVITRLRDPSVWKSHPIDLARFTELLSSLQDFCKTHKSALGSSYRQDKEFFHKLYKQSVLKRKVLIIHSPHNSPDVLKETLTTGGYYEVETVPVNTASEKAAQFHVTLFLCTDAREASQFLVRHKRLNVDLFLSDLGREIPVLNLNLCRTVNQAQRKGMQFFSPPYVAMKLLPAIEESYVRRLAELDRTIAAQETALAQEEDALIRGMDEAILYAELIVESAWRKTAGFSVEKAL